MSALSRDEIISIALQQAGNTTITNLARDWLNNILDRLYEDEKWPFQKKSTEGVVGIGATSVDLPEDFLDVWNDYGLRLVDSQGREFPLKIRDEDYLDLVSDPSGVGTPEIAVLDFNSRTWRPYPLTNQSFSWRLRYKYKPERLESNDDSILFPNDQLLIEAIYTMALRYEDDDRAPQDLAFLTALIRKYKKGINRHVSKTDKFELNPEVFRTIFPLR